MPNADMDRLMDMARIRLPGALDSTILIELFAVLKEFFEETNLWQETITFDAVPTTLTYHEAPEAYTYDVRPYEGTALRLMALADASGYAVSGTMPVPGCVILERPPPDEQVYSALLSITVLDPVTRDEYPVFPDWVMAKYQNTILDGLLWRMMTQPAKPYSSANSGRFHSTNAASRHYMMFKSGKAKARVEARRQHVYGAQPWRFPRAFIG